MVREILRMRLSARADKPSLSMAFSICQDQMESFAQNNCDFELQQRAHSPQSA
jgi:hypothetical protein